MEIQVTTHSGEVLNVKVEEYNPIDLNAQLNNSDVHTIELGGIIFSRIDIKMVRPIESIDDNIVKEPVSE